MTEQQAINNAEKDRACRDARAFCLAHMGHGRWDYFPLGHPIGYHDDRGQFHRSGTVMERYAFHDGKWVCIWQRGDGPPEDADAR